jgi:hypothetical protein
MKVLLVVVDAASPRVVYPAIQTGQLPNLKRIADAGRMHPDSATIFPSITPAATASIITGLYPAQHGIAGAAWYDEARQSVAYYGDDFWVITKEGYGAFLREFLVGLNGDRLKAPTLFELVEDAGLRAACLNYLVFRGNSVHRVNVPWLLALLPGVPITETIAGPSVLCLGNFVNSRPHHGKPAPASGLLHRFGMDDASTAKLLCELAAEGAMGDFTLAYFADNDYKSHEVGPHKALPVVQRVDAALGAMFDAAGGFERFIRDTSVIVTSDHGHTEILPDESCAVIRLDRVLSGFQQADVARGWRKGEDVMICPNMRAAQIYLRDHRSEYIDPVVQAAFADPRVDLALWHRRLATAGSDVYVVESQHGRLEFWRGETGADHARDRYGTNWSWRGELAALSLEIDGGVINSPEYPNPFERIAGVLDGTTSGDVWLTAQPGCEFEVPGGKAHVGGASHGSLHVLDSHNVLLASGRAAEILPRHMRTIDIAPVCMELLGLTPQHRPGDPR